ncbi:MAG: 2TM domain-containing protein [Flavobacterium sp.]
MRRRYKSDFEEHQPEDKYAAAVRKVKRLKGFYTHFIVYLCVNILIVFININDLEPGESYFKIENFFTAFFWGIGLLTHGLSVFGHIFFFGSRWEERKIKEFMEEDKDSKWE